MMHADLSALRDWCHPSVTKVILISVLSTSLFFAALCLGAVIYKKRWKLRFWLFVIKSRTKRALEASRTFEFDGFVCHDSSDLKWIVSELLPEMEDVRGFKLCLAERDFTPGYNLHEHIVDYIDRSKKTILILTPNFIQSQWCSFEVSMALNKTIKSNHDVIVPVILQSLPLSAISKTLYSILKHNLYLEWDTDRAARELFWVRLADALGGRPGNPSSPAPQKDF
jgi:hypothetical protein